MNELMSRIKATIVGLVLLACCVEASAETVSVSPQTLEAVRLSDVTNEVVLADGVYRLEKTLTLAGKIPWQGALVVRSASGDPAKCVLESAMANGRALVLGASHVRVEGICFRGFSLTNEMSAVWFRLSDVRGWVEFRRCRFEKNVALNGGASGPSNVGYYDCVFLNNRALKSGGALLAGGSTIVGCTFRGNVAERGDGGAVCGSFAMTNCTFAANGAPNGYGGAVASRPGDWGRLASRMTGCTFTDNFAETRSETAADAAHGSTGESHVRTIVRDCTFKGSCQPIAGASKGPFKNEFSVRPGDDLVAVRDRIRRTRDPKRPVTVWLEDGIYAFTNRVELTSKDGDTHWKVRHPGKVTVVGGRVLDGRKVRKLDPSSTIARRLRPEVVGKVRCLSVPENLVPLFSRPLGGMTKVGEQNEDYIRIGYNWAPGSQYPVFAIDGRYQYPARWPNDGEFFKMKKELLVHGDTVDGKATNNVIRCPSERAATWDLSRANAFVWGFTMNACAYATTWKRLLRRTSEGDLEISRGWGSLNGRERFQVVNLLEELDVPGEWCFEPTTRTICFIPPEGFGTKSVLALGYGPDHLFRILGDGISVEGIRFTAKNGLPTVCIEQAQRTRLADCTFSALDGVAVFAGGRRTKVENCEFFDTVNTGLMLMGGVAKTCDWGRNQVINCHFHDNCLMKSGWSTGSIYLSGAGNRIAHCLVHDNIEHGIDYVGVGNVLEYNRVHDVTIEYEDSGAVYTPGGSRSYGNVFRYNDVGSAHNSTHAIYCDDWSSGNIIYGNVLRNYEWAGVFLGGGRDNIVSNNLIIAGRGSVGLHVDNRGLVWPQYKDPVGLWKDISRRFDLPNGPLAKRYPKFAAWGADGTNMCGYLDCQWVNNLVIDCSEPTNQGDAKGRTVATNRVHSSGNVYVSTKGDPWAKLWKLGGFTCLRGTKDAPLDLGFRDMPPRETTPDGKRYVFRKGDFNLKPDAKLKELMPQFKPIPWDKIGLCEGRQGGKVR